MDISRFLMGSLVVGSLENKVSKYMCFTRTAVLVPVGAYTVLLERKGPALTTGHACIIVLSTRY